MQDAASASAVTPQLSGDRGRTADERLATSVAWEAAERLLRLRSDYGFADPALLRAAGDRAAQEVIAARLANERPGDAVLSEEATDDARRLASPRVWIIDPLDGTREFAEQGRTDWAVHVALWERGRLTAAAVALPAEGRTLSTSSPPARPAWRGAHAPRIAVSRTRAPSIASDIAAAIGAELVPMGSAGAKVTAVVLGSVEAYVHAGGQFEWDSAAPVAVAHAAGLHASRLNGSSLVYNQEAPVLPDLLVCVPELATPIIKAAADAGWPLETEGRS